MHLRGSHLILLSWMNSTLAFGPFKRHEKERAFALDAQKHTILVFGEIKELLGFAHRLIIDSKYDITRMQTRLIPSGSQLNSLHDKT
jgi:hypothetical protein